MLHLPPHTDPPFVWTLFTPFFSFRRKVVKAHCGCSAGRIKRSRPATVVLISTTEFWATLSLFWVKRRGFSLLRCPAAQPAGSGLVHFVHLHLLLCVQIKTMKRGDYVGLFHYLKRKWTSLNRTERSSPTYPCLSPLSGSFTSGEDSEEAASEDRSICRGLRATHMTTGKAADRIENKSEHCFLLLCVRPTSTLNT